MEASVFGNKKSLVLMLTMRSETLVVFSDTFKAEFFRNGVFSSVKKGLTA